MLGRGDLEALIEAEFGGGTFHWRRCSQTGPLVVVEIDNTPSIEDKDAVCGFQIEGGEEDDDSEDGGYEPMCQPTQQG